MPKNSMRLIAGLAAMCALTSLLAACGTAGDARLRSSPPLYLDHALQTIKNRALNKNKVDWQALRTKCHSLIKDAKTTEGTYPAITFALSQLGDNHSFLMDRQQRPCPMPERSGDRSTSDTQAPRFAPHESRVDSGNPVVLDDKRFGLVVVPALNAPNFGPQAQQYTKKLHKQISTALDTKPSGWIIDLRGNGGGNMWPMLVGVGPVLGSDTVGYFVYPNVSIAWFYDKGGAGVINSLGRHNNYTIHDPLSDCAKDLPVAVLIDSKTASSGEAVAISFKGRPQSRFFGDFTAGLSTNNEQIKLPDGATLYLTTSIEADRNKVPYDRGVAPDEYVGEGEYALGDANDVCLNAAKKWLAQNCK